MTDHPRFLSAGNAGPFTLDGTRTYLVGRKRVAVIDPGPVAPAHVVALVELLRGAHRVSILVTHPHADHAPGAASLAAALEPGAEVSVHGPRSLPGVMPLTPGEVFATDEGDLVAVATPGHAREHFAFHWPDRRALFAGDLVLGRGDTVWVGEYAGSVADYLDSLERVRALHVQVIYPAHGDPIESPAETLDRFAAHRRARIAQVRAALEGHPAASAETLLGLVYGSSLPKAAERAALRSMEALKAHVEGRRE